MASSRRMTQPAIPPPLAGRTPFWKNAPAARFTTGLALAVVLTGVAAFGLKRLDRWGEHFEQRQSSRIRVRWADVPTWLSRPDNQHIFDDLMARAGLSADDSVADRDLTRRVGEALSDPHVGWIKRLDRVIAKPPDLLIVYCEFRKPAAWVIQGEHAYLVDAEGVRLPGTYAHAGSVASGLLELRGLREPPPECGRVWPGADATAALAVARLVDNRPFSAQITAVDVDNFNARVTKLRPHIELWTDRPDARIWWGRAPGAEDATEIRADQKVSLLTSIYQYWGRVDMGRANIDITTWSNKVALPAAADPDDTEPTLRG